MYCILHYLKRIFTPHLTLHGSTLWNNAIITISRKTLLKQDWYEKIVSFDSDLMNEHGHLIQFNSFIDKFNLQFTFREFCRICKATPLPLKHAIQNTLLLFLSKLQSS